MTLTPVLRKLMLTSHVVFSIGWIGAVTSFLALAIVGLTSQSTPLVNSAYLAMDMIAWFIIVPLSFASPLTGIVQSLGTHWGLFRHYWVLIKFLITIPSTAFLMLHMRPIGHLAHAAEAMSALGSELSQIQIQMTVDAAAALVVLLVATTLAIYKPKGITPYGVRKLREDRASRPR